MNQTLTFTCSICGEPSADICVYCTKDACANHRCLKCLRCSDCCECDLLAYRRPSFNGVWNSRSENQSSQVPRNDNSEKEVNASQQQQPLAAPAEQAQRESN